MHRAGGAKRDCKTAREGETALYVSQRRSRSQEQRRTKRDCKFPAAGLPEARLT